MGDTVTVRHSAGRGHVREPRASQQRVRSLASESYRTPRYPVPWPHWLMALSLERWLERRTCKGGAARIDSHDHDRVHSVGGMMAHSPGGVWAVTMAASVTHAVNEENRILALTSEALHGAGRVCEGE
jgi:hypothetical protein